MIANYLLVSMGNCCCQWGNTKKSPESLKKSGYKSQEG